LFTGTDVGCDADVEVEAELMLLIFWALNVKQNFVTRIYYMLFVCFLGDFGIFIRF